MEKCNGLDKEERTNCEGNGGKYNANGSGNASAFGNNSNPV